MRIRYIEIFHAVMQSGTVKGAAEMLHITQPAATRLLQQAEAHVGVPLFQRVRGRLLPTAEAHQLFPEVEQLYLKLDAVRHVAANLGQDAEAMLRVLCVPGLALEALSQALGRWSRRRPKGRFSLRTLHSCQIAESLALRVGIRSSRCCRWRRRSRSPCTRCARATCPAARPPTSWWRAWPRC